LNNKKANKLIEEKSPYLLQHADNPVNWFPWGDEAFTKSKEENKPIFLSIGYSTCHWCHVMAHESFEDEEVAEILNKHFISIKVDREERPDIDSIYMKVCQMMTGHGGWPLSIFMTPDKVPFYAGTYFPKNGMYGRPGFIEVITQLSKKFQEDPAHIQEVTESVVQALARTNINRSKQRLTTETVQKAYSQLNKLFDLQYGGFGDAPKFPSPHNLFFLLRYYHVTGNRSALNMVEKTLQAMAEGGIYDHIGFGFARYATDREWLVPHFEKMLYDNALLVMAYTECYQITKNPLYQKIIENTITFIFREMLSPEGAFYSAIDADSEGVEGKFYVWSLEEVYQVLGEELGELFTNIYNFSIHGNFEGKNIPNLIGVNMQEKANQYGMTMDELEEKLEECRQKLWEHRNERTYPHLDDKILTSWNGLMIAALAKAGKVLGHSSYIDAAKSSLQFIEKHLKVDGRLMVRYREGEVKNKGFIDEYAYLLWAYVELYEATFEIDYVRKAKSLVEEMFTLFWDENNGGFFFIGQDQESILTREKEVYDGALPSGNNVALVMLARLASLTGEIHYLERVEEMYFAFKEAIEPYPTGSTYFLQGLLYTEYPSKEVVILGNRKDLKVKDFLSKIRKTFLPNVTVLFGESGEILASAAPFTKEYKKLGEETTIYVCENFACKKPTTNLEEAWSNIVVI
jgi:uncharacterized protein